MTKKEKELEAAFPILKDQKIKVWVPGGGSWYCTGVWSRFTGTYIILTDVTIWNGMKFPEKMVNSRSIAKIELYGTDTSAIAVNAAGPRKEDGGPRKD